jgi:GntR family transcriptional regulator
VSAYLELSDAMADELVTWPPGTPLPSENELAERCHVNRLTARAVLQELERRHLVRRVQGRGTFVATRLEYRIDADGPASWTQTVLDAGGSPRTVNSLGDARPATDRERELLELSPGARVVQLSRLRYVNDELAGLSDSVLPAEVVPDLGRHLTEAASLYRVLVDDYRYRPVRTWSRTRIQVADEDLASRLKVKGRPMLINTRGQLADEHTGQVLETSSTWMRSDFFDLVVELRRRPTR